MVRFTWEALLQSSHASLQPDSSGLAHEAVEKFQARGSCSEEATLKLATQVTFNPVGSGDGWLTQPAVEYRPDASSK